MTAAAWARPLGGLRELQKLSAFARRDFLFAWSYRTAFFSDWIGLGVQAVLLSFVGRLAKDSAVPSYNGQQATYMAFAMIGVAIGVFLQLGLDQIATGMRQEQLMGTLEPLLLTPTAPSSGSPRISMSVLAPAKQATICWSTAGTSNPTSAHVA